MNVLVTGGAGYIGSHTVVELLNAGHQAIIVDDLSNAKADVIDRIETITGKRPAFYKLDCKSKDALRTVFSAHKIDAIIHFAAFKAVGESVAQPIKYYRNNLDSFLNILDASIAHGGCNVLFSSSATVYGETDKLPVTEESPRQSATSPYGNTKQICEDILRDVIKASAAYGTEVNAGAEAQGPVKGIALRYFNPIGAHPSALIGELPRGVPNNLVPFITQTAIGKRACLSIFGNDYPTPDGFQNVGRQDEERL